MGEHTEDIRGADEAKEEEDLVKVRDMFFDIIAECQDTTCGSVQDRQAHHADIVFSLTTQ